MGIMRCQTCKIECLGKALRVQDKYFHMECFVCSICDNSLAQGGYFLRDNAYYCTADYHRNFGTKCATCEDYVEGEVVTVLGKTYHQRCLTCIRCQRPFRSGEEATCTGTQIIICQRCIEPPMPCNKSRKRRCAGCGKKFKKVEALAALGQHWHIGCFKCTTCGIALPGKHMERDSKPYCEKDYQKHFGVKCAHCNRFIFGKVLHAGENLHFHWLCAKCTICGDIFIEGEEMDIIDDVIWHPRCGPETPPETDNGQTGTSNGYFDTDTDSREFDWDSTSEPELQFSLCSSSSSLPTSTWQEFYGKPSPAQFIKRNQDKSAEHSTRAYPFGCLTEKPRQGYLHKPKDPWAHTMLTNDSAKIYSYQRLMVVKNNRLPADVDRLNLERHLSDAEFEAVFRMSRNAFYEMQQWRRNKLKRRVMLF